MPTNYPTSLDSLTNPTSSDPQNNPSHSGQHANANDAIEAIETFLGTSSAPLPTILNTDGTLAANSDVKIASQKATKTYADTKLSISSKATAVQAAAGTDDTNYLTSLSAASHMNYGLSRQAIINGNFDVWQRGTSFTPTDLSNIYGADRWYDYVDKNGGTLPTLTRSKLILGSGDIPGSSFYSRIAFNGAGTSLGATSVHQLNQRIENGTSKLCGLGKKVTISFWARSATTNKKIGLYLFQNYGTGGSPSTNEVLNGTNWTLTSTWTKYSYTFTTNTLVGKTLGTNNDDFIQLIFLNMWGSSNGILVGATGVAETYVGSGNIDIAQVQLCAGDVALPFNPKSFEEELRACQRYYEVVSGTHYGFGTNGCFISVDFPYKVTKRTAVTPSFTEGSLTGCSFNSNVVTGIDNAVRAYNGTSGTATAMSVVGAIAKCDAEL